MYELEILENYEMFMNCAKYPRANYSLFKLKSEVCVLFPIVFHSHIYVSHHSFND